MKRNYSNFFYLSCINASHTEESVDWFAPNSFFGKYIQQILGFLAVLMLASIWIFTYSRVIHEKKISFEDKIVQSRNVSIIVALNLQQILNKTSVYAKNSHSYIEDDTASTLVSNPVVIGDPTYLRLAIFSNAGKLVYSSVKRTHEPEMSSLVQQAIRHGVSPDKLMLIGLPGKNNAAWHVPLLIPVQSHTGERIGFFTTIIDLSYFLQLYKSVNLGKDGRIGIFSQAGIQIAELRGSALSSEPNFSSKAYGTYLMEKEKSGVINTEQGANTMGQIGFFQNLDNYPLAITVTHDKSSLLDGVHEKQNGYIVQATVVSLVAAILLWMLSVLMRRQQELLTGLIHSEKQKQSMIHKLEQEKNRAYELASHDHLTGIPNRMLFHEMAQAELSRAKRSRNLYALLFLDLNRFKPINDSLGHDVGDLLLLAVAQRLRKSLRAYDIVARIGGDEFVIMLCEVSSKQQIAHIAAKIIQSISMPFDDLNGHSVEISTSIGIALYPGDGQNANTLLRHADAAMYCAKKNGTGKYCFYTASLNESSVRHFELISRFRLALKENEFCLHYQPKIDLQKFEITGLEALIRWNHPEHGLVYPGEFIEVFEKNDLIGALGEWIINEACRQLASWQSQGISVVPIAVNISARQLRDGSIQNIIVAALNRHRVSADLLEIEITESCLIDDFDTAKRLLESLRRLGIKIAIDDYGTGFSGLSSLKRLPIYAVKIDKSFIRDLRNDASDAVIVASTITLSHNLGLIVVAEGVESREQAVHLKTAGCDQVQGFYFQRPVSAEEIKPMLKQRVFYPKSS
jgi:diguanylate cyclase (GGDEF)-like protein